MSPTSVVERWRSWVEPGPHGLPSGRVLAWFPLLLLVGYVVLVAGELSGSSTGSFFSWFHAGSDPHAVLGEARSIRSDEWLKQQSWVVSQYHDGFPAVSPSMPGGTDLTLLYDVPTHHWSTVFRPQLWGYLVLGLGHGLAWQWWLPQVLTAVAAYLFVVTVLPRRPVTAALTALAVVVAPLPEWWHQSSVFYAMGWPLLAITTVIWLLRHPSRRIRWAWIAISAYFAVTLMLCFYLPFILTGVWTFLLIGVGFAVEAVRSGRLPLRTVLLRLGGFAAAGAVAGAVMVAFVVSRRATIELVTGTVYPGDRSTPPGTFRSLAGFVQVFGAPWNGALKRMEQPTALGPNQSEASASFMLAAFLACGLVVLIAAHRRRTASAPWPALATLAALLLPLAWLFVPGWGALAKVMFLDDLTPARLQLAFTTLIAPVVALGVTLAEQASTRVRVIAGVVAGASAVALNVVEWRHLRGEVPNVLAADTSWRVVVLLVCLAAAVVVLPRLSGVGMAAAVVATAIVSVGVNPLYQGISDLHESAAGRAVDAVDRRDPGRWVGISYPFTLGVLVESDVRTWEGVQSYPTAQMWDALDPTGASEQAWNRYAVLMWTTGTGPATITSPTPDTVVVTFDPCGDFAQEHLDYVLARSGPQASTCLRLKRTIDTDSVDLDVYRIVAPRN